MVIMLCGTACAGATVQQVLDDYRGTDTWTQSSEAFKTIMRNYVHGDPSVTDEELDQQFEDYITLSPEDVDAFIRGQSCLPPAGSQQARFYMANATHQRHDSHYAADQAHPITGTGDGETLHATFSANMLLERHELDASATFPERATMTNAPFPSWASIVSAMTERATFDAHFKLRDPAQADALFERTSAIDWSEASGELFIAPPLTHSRAKHDKYFSPALFAVYVFRASASAPFSIYLVVSADAHGNPTTTYAGLAGSARGDHYDAYTGTPFTYLSDGDNFLDYEVVMTGDEPTSLDLWITVGFPDHPQSPYITVRTAILPAVSDQAVASFKDADGAFIIMMLRKGALMRDLIAAYYPDASALQLWEDVGAIKRDRVFLERLEAAGLTAAGDLFESKLWLEQPVVKPTSSEAAPHYEVRGSMDLRCEPDQR